MRHLEYRKKNSKGLEKSSRCYLHCVEKSIPLLLHSNFKVTCICITQIYIVLYTEHTAYMVAMDLNRVDLDFDYSTTCPDLFWQIKVGYNWL